jgi:hypothetical protein
MSSAQSSQIGISGYGATASCRTRQQHTPFGVAESPEPNHPNPINAARISDRARYAAHAVEPLENGR